MSFVGQVLHVFRKDVGRFWPALLGVGALMAVHRTVGLPVPSGHVRALPGPIPVFPLLFTVFTAILVQDHRVDGSFWTTRPLDGLAILVGKVVFIGTFLCLVPALVQAQWLVEVAGGGDVSTLFASSMLHQAGLLALVAAGAAVTPSLGAFVALAVPVWLGIEALMGLLTPSFRLGPDSELVAAQTGILLLWGWLILGLGLLVHQFTTRRSLRTVWAGSVGLAIVVLGAFRIPLDVVPDPLEPDRRYAYPHADSMEIRLAWLSNGIQVQLDGSSTAHLHAGLAPEGGPGVVLRASRVRSVLHVDGRTFDHVSNGDLDFPWEAVLDARVPVDGIPPAVRRGDEPLRPNSTSVSLLHGPLDEMERLQAAERLDLQTTFDVYSMSIAAELPLEVGAVVRVDEGTVEILDIRREGQAIQVSLTYRLAASYPSHPLRHLRNPTSAALLNPSHRAYVPFYGGSGGLRPPDGVPTQNFVGGAYLGESTVKRMVDLEDAAEDGPPFPPGWLDNAVLLLTEPVYEGSFSRTFTVALDSLPAPNRTLILPRSDGPGGDR